MKVTEVYWIRINLSNFDNVDAWTRSGTLTLPTPDEGVEFTEDAIDLALQISGGYPYFLQELGSAVWGVGDDSRLTVDDVRAAEPIYQSKLDSSFFRVRLDRATEMQRVYLRAMAELGPGMQKAQDVAEVMSRTSSQVAPLRAELINMGLLFTPEHGYAEFTVPHFEQFMARSIPILEVPPVASRKKQK